MSSGSNAVASGWRNQEYLHSCTSQVDEVYSLRDGLPYIYIYHDAIKLSSKATRERKREREYVYKLTFTEKMNRTPFNMYKRGMGKIEVEWSCNKRLSLLLSPDLGWPPFPFPTRMDGFSHVSYSPTTGVLELGFALADELSQTQKSM